MDALLGQEYEKVTMQCFLLIKVLNQCSGNMPFNIGVAAWDTQTVWETWGSLPGTYSFNP